jgi:hypothetical protein
MEVLENQLRGIFGDNFDRCSCERTVSAQEVTDICAAIREAGADPEDVAAYIRDKGTSGPLRVDDFLLDENHGRWSIGPVCVRSEDLLRAVAALTTG